MNDFERYDDADLEQTGSYLEQNGKAEEDMEMTDLKDRLMAEGMNYRNMSIPEEMEEKLDKAIRKAKKVRGFRIPTAIAAAAVLLVLLPNTGANIAYAMGNIPVVGILFQAVTFRNYQYDSDRFQANVEVPQIVVKDIETNGNETEVSKELEKSIDEVNFDIQKVTDQLIAEFEASAEYGESYGGLEISHEIVTDSQRYFSLKLFIYQGAGSGTQWYKIYTIDKLSGQQIQIGDLFFEGSDYQTVISENIREQMRAAMAEDEKKYYWVDDEEIPELNWKGLEEDQNFYFDLNGNLVIAFDEYEVAPGYMGAQEFTVEKGIFENLLK